MSVTSVFRGSTSPFDHGLTANLHTRTRPWTGRGVDPGHIKETDREVKSDKTKQWPDLVTTRSLYLCKHVERKTDRLKKRETERRIWKRKPRECVCQGVYDTMVFLNVIIIPKCLRPLSHPQFWPVFDRESEVVKRRSPPLPIMMLNSCVAVTTAWPAVTPIRPATDGAGSWEKG